MLRMNKKAQGMKKLGAILLVLFVFIAATILFYNLWFKTASQGVIIIDNTLSGVNDTKILTPQEKKNILIDELQMLKDEGDIFYNENKFDEALAKYELFVLKSKEYSVSVLSVVTERIREINNKKLFATLDEATKLSNDKDYEEAITKYEEYLEKSKELDIIAGTFDEERVNEKILESLNKVRVEADQLYVQDKFSESLLKYEFYVDKGREHGLSDTLVQSAETKITEIKQKLSDNTFT